MCLVHFAIEISSLHMMQYKLTLHCLAMSSFPPADWECRYVQDFESFAAASPAPSKLHVQALLAVR
jgi:hypothetical protein